MTGSASDVARALEGRHRFLLTSHARPDGDAIGSQLAMAFALERLGKEVRLVNRDPVPAPYRAFPGVDRIEVLASVEGPADALIVMECTDLSRPELAGLDRYPIVNIDHHLGNRLYGQVNWFDETAAACGEMVADVIDALGVAWSQEMATHLYLAVTTDTGSFRHGLLSARTFELGRRIAATGVDVAALSRQIFDSYSIGRVRLTGRLLNDMTLHAGNRVALLAFDDALLAECGASADDTDGLVNLPLGASDVQAVALLKLQEPDTYRVSFRSKGDVDVRAVAQRWNGGGHKNAAGCTITGTRDTVRQQIIDAFSAAVGLS